jgi:hypothetical protein
MIWAMLLFAGIPVLERECQGCHGATQQMSKLDLRSRESMLRGGSRGPAVVPGNAEASLLYRVLTGADGRQMPPSKRLPADMIAGIKNWIDAGAPWSESDNWAFRPVPPHDRSRSVDSFLPATPRADRRTLIRRITFDLTGLPPTPEEMASRESWTQIVDRLLASPRYGERWARHWLDVARYADTSGYSNDFERPNAWRYRDYVIRAFNNDKPYDRFTKEQIAGDELYPGDAEALIATGFLRAGPWEHTSMSVEAVTRQLFLDDVTHSTASTFLGLTLGCARCHDHKFDPIPTRDYYRMQAVFATTEFARPVLPFLPSENTSSMAAGAARMGEKISRAKAAMDRLPAGTVEGEAYEEFRLHQKHLALYRESAGRFEPKAFAVSSGPQNPATVHILPGGNVTAPGEQVTPGVLSALPGAEIPQTASGRRAALAGWIADARNPLTARVLVNRVWQYHFGRGIAADASNFGKMGAKPTNPELLDWLAAYFVESGWSVKALHRAILLSAAYQSASLTPRRLEAEALRDSVLAVSGELSLEAGGPGTFPEINEDVARQPQQRMGSVSPAYHPSARKSQRHRRTIYMFQQRTLVDPMVEVFNGPTLDLACERRDASTVPTQAFALFNSQFMHEMALAFALRLEREAPSGVAAQVERAFRLAYGREPGPEEFPIAMGHLERLTIHHTLNPTPARAAPMPVVHTITSELTGKNFRFVQQEDPEPYEHNVHPLEVKPSTRALADFVLVLLNSNEFVYVY